MRRTAIGRIQVSLFVILTFATAQVRAGIIPKSSFIENPATPPPLNLDGDSTAVHARLDTVIAQGGEGSWYREAKWDEYVITLASKAPDSLQIMSVRVVDPRGVFINSETEPPVLINRTEKLANEYENYSFADMGVTTAVTAGISSGVLGVGAGSLMFSPAAIVAGPAYLLWRNHVYKRDMERLGKELQRRTIPVPMTLASGASATASFFFPIVPSPRKIAIDYQAGSAPIRQLYIELTPLRELHLTHRTADNHPAVTASASPTPAAASIAAVPNPVPAPAADKPSAEERLRKLNDLLGKGLISKTEYERKRAEILASM